MPGSLFEEVEVEGLAERGCDWEVQAARIPSDRL